MQLFCWKQPQKLEEAQELGVFPPAISAYEQELEKHVNAILERINQFESLDCILLPEQVIDTFSARDTTCCCRLSRSNKDVTQFYSNVIQKLKMDPQVVEFLKRNEVDFHISIDSFERRDGYVVGSLQINPVPPKRTCLLL